MRMHFCLLNITAQTFSFSRDCVSIILMIEKRFFYDFDDRKKRWRFYDFDDRSM